MGAVYSYISSQDDKDTFQDPNPMRTYHWWWYKNDDVVARAKQHSSSSSSNNSSDDEIEIDDGESMFKNRVVSSAQRCKKTPECVCTNCIPPGEWKGTVDENGVATGESYYNGGREFRV